MDFKNTAKRDADRAWTALNNIIKHFGVSKHDRYAGEFGCLRYVLSMNDEAARDNAADTFRWVAEKNGWKDLEVLKENKADKEYWPYQMELVLSGASTREDACKQMAEYCETVAARIPSRPGQAWEDFIAEEKRFDKEYVAPHQVKMMGTLPTIYRGSELYVVGSHRSKSIALPVAQLEMPRNMTLVTFRDNFHDLCVSVDAKFPIQDTRDFKTLFNTKAKEGFFEGFPARLVHGAYEDDPQKFSFCTGNVSDLMIVLSEVFNQDWAHNSGIKPKPVAPAGLGQARRR